jgi:cardiolipin synthase
MGLPSQSFFGMGSFWNLAAGLLLLAVDIAASVHAVLHKRDTRAAISWVGLIWLTPGFGVVLYALFGLNRIRRQAAEIQRILRAIPAAGDDRKSFLAPPPRPRLAGLALLGEKLTGRPLLTGNSIAPLENGDQAYPAMIAAIDSAEHSVSLCSYIFADDAAGSLFVDALGRAAGRGVEVRVLIDDVGMRYTRPPVHRALKRAGVRVARFLPIVSRTGIAFFNLRTHRKALVVDGTTAFAGGMNIHADNVHATRPRRPVRDVHFEIHGPVAQQLQDAFAEDWAFATGERLRGPRWYPDPASHGGVAMRVITDGPDGDFERVRHILLAAIASARSSIGIVTPYFLPDAPTIAALSVAALRGVRVDIVLPAKGNVALAQWAATAQLWQLLKPGCRVHLSPPPFDHSKLFVIDRSWAMIGTTNWDPRSLRLNFELDVECFDEKVAGWIDDAIAARIAASRPFTLEDADARSLLTRIRDGVARLASPYL